MAKMISREFVEAVRQRVDLAGIVGGYVPLRRQGNNLIGLCPFHSEKTPSFSVSPDKNYFYCFGCHKGGDVFKFLMEIDGLSFVDDLSAYIERKLFTLNSGHAICAYLGTLKGSKTIVESIADPAIGNIVYKAMQESGEGLIRKHGFDPAAHHAYIDRIFARFQNPYLEDETARVAREPLRKLAPTDRLIKPLVTAYGYGLNVDHLVYGAAAALLFDCPEDPQSVELQEKIGAEGVEKALEAYTGLKPEDELFGKILAVYHSLEK